MYICIFCCGEGDTEPTYSNVELQKLIRRRLVSSLPCGNAAKGPAARNLTHRCAPSSTLLACARSTADDYDTTVRRHGCTHECTPPPPQFELLFFLPCRTGISNRTFGCDFFSERRRRPPGLGAAAGTRARVSHDWLSADAAERDAGGLEVDAFAGEKERRIVCVCFFIEFVLDFFFF